MPRIVTLPAGQSDQTLGLCDQFTFRVTFFRDTANEIGLGGVRDAFRNTAPSDAAAWERLGESLRSFHDDIVNPFATESAVPLTVLCEEFSPAPDEKSANYVVIEIPGTVRMRWEDHDTEVSFSEDGQNYLLPAHMFDCVTFFESGLLAYSVSFMPFMGGRRTALSAQTVLVLTSLLNTAGTWIGNPVRFWRPHNGERGELNAFLQTRLNDLENRASEASHSAPVSNIFGFLSYWQHASAKILKQTLSSFFEETTDSPHGLALPASISIEIVGADHHHRIVEYAEQATRRDAMPDDISLRLAGIAQNVMDFTEQDKEEVNDSLSSIAKVGSDIMFAHKGIATRFNEKSRAFNATRYILGGSPYWLLVQLVVAHNECLLWQLNQAIEKERREVGLTQTIKDRLVHPLDRISDDTDQRKRLAARFDRRMRLAHYIPNMFRYPTEQRQYEVLVTARGLKEQKEYLLGLEITIEEGFEGIIRQTDALHRRHADITIQLLLIGIGLLQIAIVLVTSFKGPLSEVLALLFVIAAACMLIWVAGERWPNLHRLTWRRMVRSLRIFE